MPLSKICLEIFSKIAVIPKHPDPVPISNNFEQLIGFIILISVSVSGLGINTSSFTLNICLRNGTTTVASFCTSHLNSVEMFFNEAKKRNMRVVGGKVCMDRNAPEGLLDNVKSSYDDSEKLINKWHKNERCISNCKKI